MTLRGHRLATSVGPLAATYDAALLDLDGVVYRGTDPVPHAVSALQSAAKAGLRLTYVTNNASRTPAEVAAILRSVGVDADPAEVATSAQAAARLLAERLAPGAAVLVIGTSGLHQAVIDVGLLPVASAEDGPAAVVQGFSDATTYAMLAEAVLAVRAGAFWVATNRDSTIPTARGLLPGNGALVAAVATATGSTPVTAGKPERPLHDEAVRRTGARRPLVVGDRLDTDIDGALGVGADSLLVLTGVTSLLEVLALPSGRRPSYVGADLRSLLEPHPAVEFAGPEARCGAASAVIDGHMLVVDEAGYRTGAIRAACALGWHLLDESAGSIATMSGAFGAEFGTPAE